MSIFEMPLLALHPQHRLCRIEEEHDFYSRILSSLHLMGHDMSNGTQYRIQYMIKSDPNNDREASDGRGLIRDGGNKNKIML